MRLRRRAAGAVVLAAAGLLAAACSSGSSSSNATGPASSTAASGQVTIGIDLTYNNTAFWAAYINYEQQYAQQMHIKLLGPLLAAANASLQNQQIEQLVNEPGRPSTGLARVSVVAAFVTNGATIGSARLVSPW